MTIRARKPTADGRKAIGSIVSESENIVVETATRIFADLADPQTLNRATDERWAAPLWRALAESGLTLSWVSEEHGGAGASLADGFAVLGVAGRFAAPVPLAETMLAGWLLASAGIASPAGPMTIAPVRPGDEMTLDDDGLLNGRARAVPFARDAGHFAVLTENGAGWSVALVGAEEARIAEGNNLAGDPSDTVTFEGARPLALVPAPLGLDETILLLMGGVVRSMQTAGALEALLAMCVRYANDRVAFERPIAKFQAVQHNLARLAGEAAAAVAAAGSAADAIANAETFDDGIFLEAVAAKIRCAEAAQEGAAIAHQIHGAIGFTKEHVLHRFSLRMLAWRDDFGNESQWAAELGMLVADRGADAFWPLVASR
jgi:alkylation response protein AidB-like acyl-CoA dehydrogenase